MKKITFLRARPKEPGKRTATESKAKLELLARRAFDPRDDIEDIMGVKRGKEIEEVEASDTLHEKELFRRGLGFQQIASRGYSISPKNVIGYYELKLQFRELLEEDPDMEDDFTKEVYSLYVNAKNNLLQRTITIPQTNVEVVDQEPVVKYIPMPSWFKGTEVDMEKKEE